MIAARGDIQSWHTEKTLHSIAVVNHKICACFCHDFCESVFKTTFLSGVYTFYNFLTLKSVSPGN